ncbi:hypothetical protein ACS0TY_030256 [Phlomoides rotata]
MSDTAKDAKVCLKVMVNKEKTKVLFAEADCDFVSVLISFLLLPLGRIVKLLEKHYGDKSPAFGSITSLYKGLANLDDAHFSTTIAKLMLLDPPSSFDSVFRKLKLLDVFKDSHPTKCFTCDNMMTTYCMQKSKCMYYGGSAICNCGLLLNEEVFVEDSGDAEVFTIKTASFIICDDLKMVPNSAGFFQTLRNFGNTVVGGAELRNLNLGTNEIMALLKCCLLSKTPLTDFVLNNGEIISSAAKPDPGFFLYQMDHNEEPTTAKEIILKVMVHKYSNKVLFAEAEDDFIELLFSFLIIPIGGVESLLGTHTSLNNLDNLYRSISDVTMDKYFSSLHTKKLLVNPNIPHSSKSQNTFLPLNYESPPTLYYRWTEYYSPPRLFRSPHGSLYTLKSPKGEGNYVKERTTYLVTDDLTVTPFYISSTFSILSRLNISLSDVVEREVHIGLQEGLSILKASLTSNSVLTDGLIDRITRKQPKQEH